MHTFFCGGSYKAKGPPIGLNYAVPSQECEHSGPAHNLRKCVYTR